MRITAKARSLHLRKGTIKSDINRLLRQAFIVRVIICTTILIIGQSINELYFISDDISYEKMAKSYLDIATAPLDIHALATVGAKGYMQVFWPYVMCISAFIFKTEFAGRFINVLLSTFAVKYIYKLTNSISENHTTAMKAAKIYAFFPYPLFVCCFPIKDIYLTVAVLYAFNFFVSFQKNNSIKLFQVISCILLLTGAYFTRGGVVEILLLFFIIFIIKRFYNNKNYLTLLICVLISAIFLFFAGPTIIEAFSTKIDDYSEYAEMDTTISAIQMSGISEFYKLPFTYFFASLQPIALKLFSSSDSSIWAQLMYYMNLTIIPIACGNFLYIFSKKKNFLFWICSAGMYCAVATLSLGIFRHYLFLLPIEMINYSLYVENSGSIRKNYCFLASCGCILLILLYSLI